MEVINLLVLVSLLVVNALLVLVTLTMLITLLVLGSLLVLLALLARQRYFGFALPGPKFQPLSLSLLSSHRPAFPDWSSC